MSNTIPRLYPVDDLTGVEIRSFDGSQYVYGIVGTTVVRYNYQSLATAAETVMADAATALSLNTPVIHDLKCLDSGAILLVAKEDDGGADDNKYFMYRSVSPFTTWTQVMRPGWTGAAHRPNRRTLGSNSILEATLADGTSAILFAEYQIQDTLNEMEVYVWISQDDGVTWDYWWKINEGTTANISVRHLHGIHQDPLTGDIFVCSGDDNQLAHVIRTPAVSRVDVSLDETNVNGATFIAAVNAVSGYYAGGNDQEWRLIDLIFNDEGVYGYADAGQDEGISANIYRMPRDLSETRMVYKPPRNTPNKHNGGGMFKTSSGLMICTDFMVGNTINDMCIFVHASKNGMDWYDIARFNLTEADIGDTVWFGWIFQTPDDNIYFSGPAGNAVAAALRHTPVVRELGEWNPSLGAEILAPVFHIKPTGNDALDGFRPSTAWQSFAENGSHFSGTSDVGPGCRVIADGAFTETNNVQCENWDVFGSRAHMGYPTVIEFTEGSSFHSTVAGIGFNIRPNDEVSPIIIRGGTITWVDGTTQLFNLTQNATGTAREFQLMFDGVTIGSSTQTGAEFLSISNAPAAITDVRAVFRNCRVEQFPGVAQGSVVNFAAAGIVKIEGGIYLAEGLSQFNSDSANGKFELRNIVADNYANACIRINNGAEPLVQNCILMKASPASGTILLTGTTGTTGTEMTKNIMEADTFPSNLDTSFTYGTDPLLDSDYKPQTGSPAINAGQVQPFVTVYENYTVTIGDLTLATQVMRDSDGYKFNKYYPTIGAYEVEIKLRPAASSRPAATRP